MKIVLSPQDITRLADVTRWNALPGLPRQSVAEHTFSVCVICIDVFHRYRKLAFKHLGMGGPDPHDRQFDINKEWLADLGRLMQLAVLHEAPEVVFTDISTPCKEFLGRGAMKAAEARVTTQLDWPEFIAVKGDDVFSQIITFADILEALRFLTKQASKTDLQKAVIPHIAARLISFTDPISVYTPLLYEAMLQCKLHILSDSYSRLSMAFGIPLSGEVIP